MATVTTSHFVSRSSKVNCYGGSGSEYKVNLSQMGLNNQANGLRFLNKVHILQMKTHAKIVTRRSGRRGYETSNDMPLRKIVCELGMNIVFVGAEVGPWSKTGGLGDVLGGLPPAMSANGHRMMTVSPRYDQ